MEKTTPHCPLAVVKTLVDAGKVRSTVSALTGAAALGFDFDDIPWGGQDIDPSGLL